MSMKARANRRSSAREIAEALDCKCASASDVIPLERVSRKWINPPIDQATDGSDP
jgi:hypothetical protein